MAGEDKIARLYFTLLILCSVLCQGLGYGVDPALEVNLLEAIAIKSSTATGISQVPGYHNQGPAYKFEGGDRNLQVPEEFLDKTKKLLAATKDFTILATVKQLRRNTASLVSIVHGRARVNTVFDTASFLNNSRFMELFMSTRNNEIRFYYQHHGKVMLESFDIEEITSERWVRLALTISGPQLRLFLDCKEVDSRYIPQPDMVMDDGELTMWIGQRGPDKTYFRGSMQNVRIVAMPQGFLTQCPSLNRDCPTCGQFQEMANGIEELEARIRTLEHKLFTTETRMEELEQCPCARSCEADGAMYEDGETWQDACRECTCKSGKTKCAPVTCPKTYCKNPDYEDGDCCPSCRKNCTTSGVLYGHSEEYQEVRSRGSRQYCTTYTCNDGLVTSVRNYLSEDCATPNCPESERVSVHGHCCQFCQDTDHCSLGHTCQPPQVCVNLQTQYTCQCPTGYSEVNGDCLDIDECASESEGGINHYCHEGTVCVNTLGGYRCDCLPGYSRLTDTTCQQINECETGQHTCHKRATCRDTDGSFQCVCPANHAGDGRHCSAVCRRPCVNGGMCNQPGQCDCPPGFTGEQCETDIDECVVGSHDCQANTVCINLPGSYHCQCEAGYQYAEGTGCTDINECRDAATCDSSRLCTNLPGSYECLCSPSGGCSTDCVIKKRRYDNGRSWDDDDQCQMCTCTTGVVTCKPKVCDCSSKMSDAEEYCCPQCRASSQCLHQESATTVYNDGDTWDYRCQKCTCQAGTIQCTAPDCPAPNCLQTYTPVGECCPRCRVHDVCDTVSIAIQDPSAMTGCDNQGVSYSHNQWWFLHDDQCTECICRNGKICCWFNIACSS